MIRAERSFGHEPDSLKRRMSSSNPSQLSRRVSKEQDAKHERYPSSATSSTTTTSSSSSGETRNRVGYINENEGNRGGKMRRGSLKKLFSLKKVNSGKTTGEEIAFPSPTSACVDVNACSEAEIHPYGRDDSQQQQPVMCDSTDPTFHFQEQDRRTPTTSKTTTTASSSAITPSPSSSSQRKQKRHSSGTSQGDDFLCQLFNAFLCTNNEWAKPALEANNILAHHQPIHTAHKMNNSHNIQQEQQRGSAAAPPIPKPSSTLDDDFSPPVKEVVTHSNYALQQMEELAHARASAREVLWKEHQKKEIKTRKMNTDKMLQDSSSQRNASSRSLTKTAKILVMSNANPTDGGAGRNRKPKKKVVGNTRSEEPPALLTPLDNRGWTEGNESFKSAAFSDQAPTLSPQPTASSSTSTSTSTPTQPVPQTQKYMSYTDENNASNNSTLLPRINKEQFVDSYPFARLQSSLVDSVLKRVYTCMDPYFVARRGTHVFSEPRAQTFKVRGPRYMSNGVKVSSDTSMFAVLGVDHVLRAPRQPCSFKHCCALDYSFRNRLRRRCESLGVEMPFLLVINMVLPWGNLFAYLYRPDGTKGGPFNEDRMNVPAEQSWKDFLTNSDRAYRNGKLKFIPRMVAGPWMVKKIVGSNPAMIGQKIPTSYHGSLEENYLEIAFDVAGGSQVANSIANTVVGSASTVAVDLAFVVEGSQDGKDLPEQILGVFRLHHVAMKKFPTSLEWKEEAERVEKEAH